MDRLFLKVKNRLFILIKRTFDPWKKLTLWSIIRASEPPRRRGQASKRISRRTINRATQRRSMRMSRRSVPAKNTPA
jgi:hypothetical protein